MLTREARAWMTESRIVREMLAFEGDASPRCFIGKVTIKATGSVYRREMAVPGRWYKRT